MQQYNVGAELNLALRNNLTLINKGFVQVLCLRFHDSHQRAQISYGDNLAETRRLMQLLGEMQRLGVLFDPDGPSDSTDRGGPDLQTTAKDIWLSDLTLASEKLDAMRNAQVALRSSQAPSAKNPDLDVLIEEGEAYVAELRDRINGKEDLNPFDPAQAASEYEQSSLDDFFGYAEGTDEAFLQGKTETAGSQSDALAAILNTVLSNYFLAIDQFFLHGFLMQSWQEKKLAEVRIKHSVDVMIGAYRTAQRIIVSGSLPKSIFLQDMRIPYCVKVGSNPLDAIRNDLDLTRKLLGNLTQAKKLVEDISEPSSADMLSLLIEKEVGAEKWLSQKMEILTTGETADKDDGEFDAMLARWTAT